MSIEGNVLDSFFIALGFTLEKEGIDKFEKAMEDLRGTALKVGAVITAAAAGVGLFVDEVAKSVGEMYHFAEVNHLAFDELQAFNAIARENGIEVSSMDQGIANFNKRLGQAQIGTGRLLPILKKLGIGLKDAHGHTKNVDTVLGDLADKMHKFAAAGESEKNLGLGQRLGLDPGMVLLLERGSKAWREMFAEAKKGAALTAEQGALAHETEIRFGNARHTIEIMVDLIALRLMPSVEKILDRFLAWFKTMNADKTSAFNRSLRIMGALADWVGDHLTLLSELVIPALIIGLAALAVSGVGSLITLGAAIAAFASEAIAWFTAFSIAELIALFPIEAIVIAVAALALAAYEVYAHWNGIIQWFGHALNWVLGEVEKLGHGIDVALGKAGRLFGGYHTLEVIQQGASPGSANWSPSSSNWTPNQALGGSVSNSRATTVVHQISGTTINLPTSDPARAGEVIMKTLKPTNTRTLIRNSQSGKAL